MPRSHTETLFPSNYATTAICPHCGEDMVLEHLLKSRGALGSSSEVRLFRCEACDKPTITTMDD